MISFVYLNIFECGNDGLDLSRIVFSWGGSLLGFGVRFYGVRQML